MMLPTPVYAGKAYLMPVGEVMGLYSQHCGKFAVQAECSDKDVDVTASVDGNKMYLHIVNTNAHSAIPLKIDAGGRSIPPGTTAEARVYYGRSCLLFYLFNVDF